jgi:hypothetical protein
MASANQHPDHIVDPSKFAIHVAATEARRQTSYWDQICRDEKVGPELRTVARTQYLWWNRALLKMYVDGIEVSDESEDKVA